MVDEVFLTANQPQSVCRKCYNEWGGQSRTPVPTNVERHPEEILLTSVGVVRLYLLRKWTTRVNNRPPKAIPPSMAKGIILNSCRGRRPRRPAKQSPTNPNRSIDGKQFIHQPVGAIFDRPFPNRPPQPTVCRKCYNEWCGQSRTPVPTNVERYPEEILLTSVGVGAHDDSCKPRQPKPIPPSMTKASR